MASVLVKDDHKDAKSYMTLSWVGTAGLQGLFSHTQELSELSSKVVKSPSLERFNQGQLTTARKLWRVWKMSKTVQSPVTARWQLESPVVSALGTTGILLRLLTSAWHSSARSQGEFLSVAH